MCSPSASHQGPDQLQSQLTGHGGGHISCSDLGQHHPPGWHCLKSSRGHCELSHTIHHGPMNGDATNHGCWGLPAGITPLGCPQTVLQKNLKFEFQGLVRLIQRYLSALQQLK